MVLNIGVDGDEEKLSTELGRNFLESVDKILVVDIHLQLSQQWPWQNKRETNVFDEEENVLLDGAAKDTGRGVVGELVDEGEGLDLEEGLDVLSDHGAGVDGLAIVKLQQISTVERTKTAKDDLLEHNNGRSGQSVAGRHCRVEGVGSGELAQTSSCVEGLELLCLVRCKKAKSKRFIAL
jgi:hypothetical protein